MGPFFNGPFFGGGFFGELDQEVVVIKTGGKGDNERKRKSIYKPTGLTYRKPVEQRVSETHAIAKEVARTYQDVPEVVPVTRMSLAEIQEIGTLIRKQDDEEIVLLLMAASVAG